jgi:beta-lactamase regulating signal transducer with metallopeptidase domain
MTSLIQWLNGVGPDWAAAMWVVLWQSTVLAGAVWVATRFLKKAQPAVRFWLWMLVSLRLLVMPWISINLPFLDARPVETAVIPAAAVTPADSAVVVSGPASANSGAPWLISANSGEDTPDEYPTAPMPRLQASGWLFVAWLLGVALLASRLILGVCRTRRLVACASPLSDEKLLSMGRQVCSQLGLGRVPRVFVTEAPISPLATGLLRPAVVLPSFLVEKASTAELKAVIAHEFAHIRRCDPLLGWILAICETLYFFHPVLHLAKRSCLREREQACDEMVLAQGHSPADYANVLISAAELCGSFRHKIAPAVVVAESFGELKHRITSISACISPRTRISGASVAALIILGMIALPGTACSKARSGVSVAPQASPLPGESVEQTDSEPASQTPLPKIRVGVMLSEFTATGPSWVGNPYGYTSQKRIVVELQDESVELYPVVEPGTVQTKALAAILAETFPGKEPVNGADAAALRTIDVLVISRCGNMRDEVLAAIETAVKHGLGLLIRQTMGNVTPEYTPTVVALTGMTEAQYGWKPMPAVKCEAVGKHPVLGRLDGKIGTHVTVRPNGTYGLLAGIPLLRIEDMQVISPVGSMGQHPDDYVFYPLYLSQLGKGRIVGCSFVGYAEAPADLERAASGKFTVRCVTWLAGRTPSVLDDAPSTAPSVAATQVSGASFESAAEPTEEFAREAAACHMRLILKNIETFDDQRQMLPSSIADLVSSHIALEDGKHVFRNPRTGDNPGFVYMKPQGVSRLGDLSAPAETAILFELKGDQLNPRGLIGYADGHVEDPTED